jgi:protoporphyrinogen oxidase
MIKNKDVPIILGGGLAGLSACYHGNGIVYEKDNNSGGHARSHAADGFIFDEGIHVLHTSNKYILNLMEKIDAGLEIKERNAWIHSNGVLTRYPFQANTYGLPIDIVKECLLGFIENDFGESNQIKHYQDWVYYMFGKGIAEHFMIPYSKKFWGMDPKKLTTDWVNIRHPKPTLEEVINGALHDQDKGFGINAIFRYPKEGGFGYIGKALAMQCEDRIHLGMKATEIDISKKIITFNDQEKIAYKKILSSIPLPDLISLIPDAPENVIDACNKLKTNSIFVVNLGVKRENITDKSWIYFLEKEYCFIRVSFPFNFIDNSSSVAPHGCSSISVEIAYGHDNELPVSKDKIIDRVKEDLIKADILKLSDEIVFQDTYNIKYGYVIFDEERKPAVKEIHDYLKGKDIIPFGRYGLWAYLWSDEAIMSGKKAAEKLL